MLVGEKKPEWQVVAQCDIKEQDGVEYASLIFKSKLVWDEDEGSLTKY